MADLFTQPRWLWLGLILLPSALLLVRAGRLRARDRKNLGLPERRPGGIARWLMGLAIGSAVVALADPRWGRDWNPLFPPGRDVVFLVDASRSMGAEDALPDRMRLAARAARRVLGVMAEDDPSGLRAGVVAFAGRGKIVCPLSSDVDAVEDAIRSVKPGSVEPGGTDLGAGLASAIDLLGDRPAAGRMIAVFSDGEDHEQTWEGVADRLEAARIVVVAVAVGDHGRGAIVPPARPGPPGPAITTRRLDEPLERLAKQTGGAFIPLGLSQEDAGKIYRDRVEPVLRSDRLDPPIAERAEQFSWFAILAIVGWLARSWPPGRHRPAPSRPRSARPARPTTRPGVVAASAVALALVAIGSAQAPAPTPSEALNRSGIGFYGEGRYDEAVGEFDRWLLAEPGSAVGLHNAAACLFQLGRFDEALARYARAAETPEGSGRLAAEVRFGIGNTLAALGQIDAAVESYDRCLETRGGDARGQLARSGAEANRAYLLGRKREDQPGSRSPDEGSPDSEPSPKPKGPAGDPEPDPDESADGPEAPGADDRRASRSRRRGEGGAGGNDRPSPPAGSPEDDLDRAIRQIRDARNRRPDDPTPPSDGPRPSKDW